MSLYLIIFIYETPMVCEFVSGECWAWWLWPQRNISRKLCHERRTQRAAIINKLKCVFEMNRKKTKERTLLIDMKHRWHCLFSTLQRVLRSFRRFYPNMLIATEPRRWWSTSSFPLCACELVRLLHTYIVQLTAKYISGVMSHVYDRWGADLHLHFFFFWFCSRNFSLLMFSIAVAALDCCCCCGIFFF